jgi:hypothetical protein
MINARLKVALSTPIGGVITRGSDARDAVRIESWT